MENIEKLKYRVDALVQESDISASYIFEKLFTSKEAMEHKFPDKFPHMYKGEDLNFDRRDRRAEHSFCPFHGNQTTEGSAFAIFNDNKGFFCFNSDCLYSGRPLSVIELVMAAFLDVDISRLYDLDLSSKEFLEAGKILASILGKELGITERMFDQKVVRDPIDEIYYDAADYYNFLSSNKVYSKKLKKFLEGRGFQYGKYTLDELIEKFQLGITPFKNDMLYKYLLDKRHHKKEDILESKLCIERNGKIIDFFWDRAVVPYNHNGKIVGFYGRALDPDGDSRWRHMRLEGTVQVPNGIHHILRSEEFILTEGEFSNIAVKAMGYENAMETRGTNGLRDEHIELIERVRNRNPQMCKKCYFAFDPDEAGENSVIKLGEKLIDIGVEVKVIRLPDGLDPNDLLTEYKKKAPDVFEDLLNDALSYDAFKIVKQINAEDPRNPSELRMTINRLSKEMRAIDRLERAIVAEEVVLLIDSLIPKERLRSFLFKYWVDK